MSLNTQETPSASELATDSEIFDVDEATLRASQGDIEAFAAVYAHLKPMLTRVAQRRLIGLGGQEEDCVQDGFERALKKIDSYELGSASAWLTTIVVNRSTDLRRRAKITPYDHTSPSSIFDTYATPTTDLTALDLEPLATALATINPDQAAAFVACEIEGMTTTEAAELLHAPAATIRTRVFRARKALRAFGRDYFV